MVGNDIVDRLKAAKESNWKRPGYLNKLFSVEEQEVILHAGDPDLLLWLMWTMKESAYKIINRSTGSRNYDPLSFICLHLHLTATTASGEVNYQDKTLYTSSVISADFIHSIAVPSASYLPTIYVYYQAYTESYLADFNNAFNAYKLSKSTRGLPELAETCTGKQLPVSISHHGRYLAIAYSDSLQ